MPTEARNETQSEIHFSGRPRGREYLAGCKFLAATVAAMFPGTAKMLDFLEHPARHRLPQPGKVPPGDLGNAITHMS
jgi:hypothetical protein